ncbi:MAG: hypothetical protein QW057_03125, partial [Candidatus Bathyarchaeia archaeon]
MSRTETPSDFAPSLVKRFLETARASVDLLVERLMRDEKPPRGAVTLFTVERGRRRNLVFNRDRLFLRTSTEYSNVQLTLEDLQGIVEARLLEVTGNYLSEHGSARLDRSDYEDMAESLRRPPRGRVVPFLLNTDDVEPDRYSVNPLRASVRETGQSAFPAAKVTMRGLKLDHAFVAKYRGALLSEQEAEEIEELLKAEAQMRYVDFVDSFKYEQLSRLSESLGLHLSIPALRMPLETLGAERSEGPLHSLIRESHRDYGTIAQLYALMGRNIRKRKTLLLTVPHSKEGYGSKRAAQGQMVMNDRGLERLEAKYRTVSLYPNEVDRNDVSIAEADGSIAVDARSMLEYNFAETPSSPQFALYSLLSPEDAAIWHGVGKYAGTEVVRSYVSIHQSAGKVLASLPGWRLLPRLCFNLAPGKMWVH